jgi:hypothetical protein
VPTFTPDTQRLRFGVQRRLQRVSQRSPPSTRRRPRTRQQRPLELISNLIR